MEDRRTKAQILAELEEAKENLRVTTARNVELESRPTPARVPVADALAGCIRSLDVLTRRASSYDSTTRPDEPQIESVLRLLAARYGISLVDKVTEPCDRLHADDMTEAMHIDAIRGRF